jgi:hypothetical protein
MGGTMKLKTLKMGLLGLAMGGMAACDLWPNNKEEEEEELPEPIEVGGTALLHSSKGCNTLDDGSYVCDDTLARGVIKSRNGEWPLSGEEYFIYLSDDIRLSTNATPLEKQLTPCSKIVQTYISNDSTSNPIYKLRPELGSPSITVTFPKEECEAWIAAGNPLPESTYTPSVLPPYDPENDDCIKRECYAMPNPAEPELEY